LSLKSNSVDYRCGIFHGVIIASVLLLALGGCGHKTDPVYMAPVKKQTASQNATDGEIR